MATHGPSPAQPTGKTHTTLRSPSPNCSSTSIAVAGRRLRPPPPTGDLDAAREATHHGRRRPPSSSKYPLWSCAPESPLNFVLSRRLSLRSRHALLGVSSCPARGTAPSSSSRFSCPSGQPRRLVLLVRMISPPIFCFFFPPLLTCVSADG
jgi:hypothetical protein